MMSPKSQKGVQKFIALVYCYRGIWGEISHTLQTLTRLMSKNLKFKWTNARKIIWRD